ncbi:hypothetical protein N7494_001470 [Penicillium frequentans]|uniref:Uncharacterized protein n=1 Tax=Penicillium frequentans TaxID=3151616 RepID=A0AAD6D1T0_9EURO|nr:hypothetical protein N7494_001470 [Penicillium glabrum]
MALVPPPVIPAVACNIMIHQAITNGTHAALHTIMNIQRYGALGAATAAFMRGSWTAAHRNRLVPAPFANGAASEAHYANWTGAAPVVLAPQAAHPAVVHICGASGAAGNWNILQHYVTHMPTADFWYNSKSDTPLIDINTLATYVARFPALTQQFWLRVAAIPPAMLPGGGIFSPMLAQPLLPAIAIISIYH